MVKPQRIEMGQIYSILFHHRYKVVSARYNLQPLSVEESDHFSSAFNHLQNSGNTNKTISNMYQDLKIAPFVSRIDLLIYNSNSLTKFDWLLPLFKVALKHIII